MPEREPADRRERARRAVDDRVSRWTPEVSFDTGDSHDKGETSLCVGEAA